MLSLVRGPRRQGAVTLPAGASWRRGGARSARSAQGPPHPCLLSRSLALGASLRAGPSWCVPGRTHQEGALVCIWVRGQGSGVRSATRGHGPAAWLPAAHAGWSDSACPAVPEAGRPRASAPRDPAAGPGSPPPPAPSKAGRTAVSCQEGAPGSRDRAAPGGPRWWGAAAHLAQRDRGRTRGSAEPAGVGAVAERPSAGGPQGPNPREAWPGRGWPEGAGQGGGGTATSTGRGRLAVSELGVPAEPWASLAAAEAPLAAGAVRVPAAEVRWRPASPGGQAPARAPRVSCRRRSAVRVVPSVTHRPGSLPPGLGRRWLGRLSEDRF